MGCNANLGKEGVGVGKTWISPFDPRALLVFVLHSQKTMPGDTRSRMVEDWELTERGFRRSEINGFTWNFLDSISGTKGYTRYLFFIFLLYF